MYTLNNLELIIVFILGVCMQYAVAYPCQFLLVYKACISLDKSNVCADKSLFRQLQGD